MASNVDQFADLELSKEDREQIFDDPMDTQSHTSQNGSRWVSQKHLFYTYLHTYCFIILYIYAFSLIIRANIFPELRTLD